MSPPPPTRATANRPGLLIIPRETRSQIFGLLFSAHITVDEDPVSYTVQPPDHFDLVAFGGLRQSCRALHLETTAFLPTIDWIRNHGSSESDLVPSGLPRWAQDQVTRVVSGQYLGTLYDCEPPSQFWCPTFRNLRQVELLRTHLLILTDNKTYAVLRCLERGQRQLRHLPYDSSGFSVPGPPADDSMHLYLAERGIQLRFPAELADFVPTSNPAIDADPASIASCVSDPLSG